MNIDEIYMRLAIRLAKKAEGHTSPNPLVGAVIVKGGRVIGAGYHKRCGAPHAEVEAINDAFPRKTSSATLYVTLEPCDHFGRTPPCTDAIIKSGIGKVVIAMKDPNPINNGRGIIKLKKNGIEVVSGILADEACEMNKAYIKFITRKMPYVTLKMAESIDGKIATRTGDSKWITSDDSRRYVHDLRRKADAVMVGANTVIKDDPLLLSKTSKNKQPVRIVVCGKKKIPPGAKIFSGTGHSPVVLARPEGERVDLKALLKKLAGMGITNILVEGGGELAAGLIERRLVDKFLFFIAPKIIGGRDAVTSVEGAGASKVNRSTGLKITGLKRFKKDILIEAEAE